MHIIANLVYQVEFGNPSGQFLTTILNSLIVWLLFIYAMMVVAAEKKINITIQKAMQLLILASFGDDHVGVLPKEHTWFDMHELARVVKEHFGMVYTPADKVGDLKPFLKFSEVTYLCRPFVHTDGWWFAPLELKQIMDSVNWRHKGVLTKYQACDAVARSCLYECVHHGRDIFNWFRDEINDAMRQIFPYFQPIEITWDEAFAMFTQYQPTLWGCYEIPVNKPWDPTSEDFDKIFEQAAILVAQSGDKPHIPELQQVVNPLTTEVTPTVTFGDNAGKEEPGLTLKDGKSPLHIGTNPYPEDGLRTVLSRPYQIASISWAGTSAIGSLVGTISLPNDLYTIQNITQKLNRNQFFRANVVVDFRTNCTNLMYSGALQCCLAPHYKHGTNLNYEQNIYSASNLPCSILSANTNTTVSMKIPYVAPSRYWNMSESSSNGGTAEGWFGKIFLHVLAPLRLTGDTSTPTVTISVFAHFEDIEYAGNGLRAESGESLQTQESKPTGRLQRKILRRQRRIIREISRDIARRRAWAKKNLIAQAGEQEAKSKSQTEANSLTSKLKKRAKVAIKDVSKAGIGALQDLIDTGLGYITDKPTTLEVIHRNRLENFSEMSHARGTDMCTMLAMDPENAVSNDTSFFGCEKDYNLFENYKRLPSLIYIGSITASDTPGTAVAQFPVNPMYCVTDTISTTQNYEVTHLANMAQHFQFWTGSICYSLFCFTNRATSCRLAISHLVDPTYTAAITNSEFGDLVTHVMDITGDTSFDFCIPYIQKESWQPVGTFRSAELPITSWVGHNGQIVIRVVNACVVGDAAAAPVIYFAIYCSGGPDFRVARPTPCPDLDDATTAPIIKIPDSKKENKITIGKKPEEKDKKKLVAQSGENQTSLINMRLRFQKPFPTLIPSMVGIHNGVLMGEEVTSWTELFKRYTFFDSWTFNAPTATKDVSLFTSYAIGSIYAIQRFLRTFHYSRGSVRYMFKWRHTATTGYYGFTLELRNIVNPSTLTENTVSYGMQGIYVTYFPNNGTSMNNATPTVQIPFYNNFDMVCAAKFSNEQDYLPYVHAAITSSDNTTAVDHTFDIMVALGDDFTVGFPVSPVRLSQPTFKTDNNNKSA
jgi:hypothetical protein